MKKILVIAAIAVAATACTKSSVVYGPDQEIGFTPVSGQVTKAPVYGPMNNASAAYTTTETFGVFAYHKVTDKTNWSDFYIDTNPMTTYIDNKEFAYQARSGSDFGGATEAYYWPKTGLLAFAGYSPYQSLNTLVTSSTTDYPYLTITNFTQGTYVYTTAGLTNQTIDVMWFDADDQAAVNNNVSGNSVNVKFNHACSWLDFAFNATDATSDNKFKILKVTLTNIQRTGTFKSGSSSTWTLDNTLEDIVIYNTDAGETLTTSSTTHGNLLILPQALTSKGETSNASSQLVIEYQQLTTTSPLTETVTLNLEVPASDSGSWVRGKHYTYTVSFGLTEIRIAPTVTDWTTETITLPTI